MTDVRQPGFWQGLLRKAPASREALSVITLEHAAGYLHDAPPSADVIILESADALSPWRCEIEGLVAASADANTQFEWVTLSAAMEHLQRGRDDVRVALLWSNADEHGRRLLTGLVPYRVSRGYFGLPVPVWRIWQHIHTYNATPILRSGHE